MISPAARRGRQRSRVSDPADPSDPEADPFAVLLGELSDGQQWKLIRADGWNEFVVRLSEVISDLSVARRQAIVMLLFAFAEGILSPDEVRDYLADHEVDSDGGLADFISWLRQFTPPTD